MILYGMTAGGGQFGVITSSLQPGIGCEPPSFFIKIPERIIEQIFCYTEYFIQLNLKVPVVRGGTNAYA